MDNAKRYRYLSQTFKPSGLETPYPNVTLICPFFHSVYHYQVPGTYQIFFALVPYGCFSICPLKVHKHEIFFLIFFAETESLWSQGPVTRDFWKSYSIRPRYSTFKHFRACSACDEIGSQYAQHTMKFVPRMLCAIKFVPLMLSMDCTCKNVHILPLAEHARKFVPRMLSMRRIQFRVCSACAKIVSAYAQHTHATIFENDSKIPN